MPSVVDALTNLEKALGLEPTEVPEDIYDVIELRDFTGTTFLEFLKTEWAKTRDLSAEVRPLFKEYISALVAMAKMTFVSQGSSDNQIRLGTIKSFSPMAMRAFRAFQTDMRSVPAGGRGGAKTFKKGTDDTDVDASGVLSRLGLDELAKALHTLLNKQDEADTPNVTDVGKEADSVKDAPASNTENASDTTADVEKTSDEVQETETVKAAYEPVTEDVTLDEPAPAVDDKDAWAGL